MGQEQQDNCLDSQKTGNEGVRGKTGEVRSSLWGVVVCVWSLAADQADGVAGEGKIGAFGYSPSGCFLTGEGHQRLPTTLTTPVIQHEHRVRLELHQKNNKKKQAFYFFTEFFYVFQWKLKLNKIKK